MKKIGILTKVVMGMVLMLGAVSGQTPEERFRKGVQLFFEGRIKESLVEWDAQVAAQPSSLPFHWQRGIALYYAGRYQDGRDQFEVHQKVNPEDVENAVWHYLCVAKLESPEAARKVFIPITDDERVPMKEVHALFAGKGKEEAVVAAAAKAGGEAVAYADLYLGLYAEANGRKEEAKKRMMAAAAAFSAGSYMGEVSRVHCRLRGWKAEPTPPVPGKRAAGELPAGATPR
jgi:lipoprotein NlpI